MIAKRLLIIVFTVVVLGALAPFHTHSQTDSSLDDFRPLGRFRLELGSAVSSPNGIHILGTQVVVEEVTASTETADGDADTEATPDAEPAVIQIRHYFLTMLDIRGGDVVWRVGIGDIQPARIRFSPDGSIILVEIIAQDSPEEILLTFYHADDGTIISETSNFALIQTPIIPGDVNQALYTSIRFSSDNAHVIVDYYRRAEAPRCAVWRIADASLAWEIASGCGVVNPAGSAIAFVIENDDSFSDYPQIEVYDVATGEVVRRSKNEVVDFAWLDNDHMLIARPYGEPQVIWNIRYDTMASLENPYLRGDLWPGAIGEQLVYVDRTTTYFWSINTGRITYRANYPAYGDLIVRDGQLILFRLGGRYDAETEQYIDILEAVDLETGFVFWQQDWYHGEIVYDETKWQAYAYNYSTGAIDFIDLETGDTLFSLTTFSDQVVVLPDHDYVIQSDGSDLIIWGPADQLGYFPDPPQALTTGEAPLYPEPNTNFDAEGTVGAGRWLWLESRTSNSNWYAYRTEYGQRYWIPASALTLLVDPLAVPVAEP